MLRRSFLLALLAVAGCATVAPPLPGGQRDYRDELTLAGRLSVRYVQDGKPQSVQGKFLWAQHRDTTDIEIYSPLGQTVARIAIAPGHARLEQSNGDVREAASADALIERSLGWPLPVSGLRYWLQGFVRDGDRLLPAAPDTQDVFHSDGWQLRYVSWQPGDGQAVPKRIDFERAASRGELGIRIVIDRWGSKD